MLTFCILIWTAPVLPKPTADLTRRPNKEKTTLTPFIAEQEPRDYLNIKKPTYLKARLDLFRLRFTLWSFYS